MRDTAQSYRDYWASLTGRPANDIYVPDALQEPEPKGNLVYVVQGYYSDGWEDVYVSDDYRDARARLREYNDNEQRNLHRMRARRERS